MLPAQDGSVEGGNDQPYDHHIHASKGLRIKA